MQEQIIALVSLSSTVYIFHRKYASRCPTRLLDGIYEREFVLKIAQKIIYLMHEFSLN